MPFSSFFSSVRLSDRIEAFREAEGHLFEYARTRFALHHQDESNHRFELFDTPIEVPSVVKRGTAAAACQVHDDAAAGKYSIHGVKVINEKAASASTPAPLVLLHGYANGSLYFYRNLMGLNHHFKHVYALDMLGWGLSSRPKFDLVTADDKSNDNSDVEDESNELSMKTRQKVASAESFFVESLESWRQSHDLPRITLAGHSMGGYLSVAYAERYPQHVERLILLSPVGVPERQPEDESKIKSLPFRLRAMIKTARYLFEKGITPGSFLRSIPYSKSKAMVDSYIERRLPAITCEEEQKNLGEYLYQNSMLPGSGEYCLSEILIPSAFAKIPLVNRIPNIKTVDENGMEVHMVYGERDWMDWRGGIEAQRQCHKRRTEWERTKSKGVSGPPPNVFVHGVRNAGHLLMLDNYAEFNAALIAAAGGEQKLPQNAPRPLEFACNEVTQTGSYRSESKRDVLGEEEASEFFAGGGRFNQGQKEELEDNASDSEEKKVGDVA